MPAIERRPNLVDRDRTGRLIDRHFDYLGRIAEAHGRADGAAAMLAALRLRRTGEGAVNGDRTALDQRRFHDFGEGKIRLPAAADLKDFADAFDVFRARLELARRRGDEQGFEAAWLRRSRRCRP